MGERLPDIFLWFLYLAMFPAAADAQKYNFFNYQVEQGLAQSQAYGFCQDTLNRLWIATYGGLSRFDGTHFTNFTKADGLINDFSTCIYYDHASHIWAGTQTGLSRYDGARFYSFPLTTGPVNDISAIAEDDKGTIWTVDNFKLFHIVGNRSFPVAVEGRTADLVTTVSADPKNGGYGFRYSGREYFAWRTAHGFGSSTCRGQPKAGATVIRRICFDHGDPDRIWIVHKKGLLYYNGHDWSDQSKNYTLPPGDLVTMETDPFGKIWVVTTVGLFRLRLGKEVTSGLMRTMVLRMIR